MRSCLVVDDSRVVRMVARRILEQLGFATAEAANGQEALDACGTRLPDAVLLGVKPQQLDEVAATIADRLSGVHN